MEKVRIILPDANTYYSKEKRESVLEFDEEAEKRYQHLQSITTGGIKFEPYQIYYVEVITTDWPSILEYGMKYKKIGKDIPTYCTDKDLKIITKEEFEEWEYNKELEEHYENFFKYNKIGEIIAVNIDYFVNFLLERYKFKTIYSTKSETVYFYEDGIWNKKGKKLIKTQTEKILQEHSKTNIVLEIFEKIKRKTAIDWDKFNEIPEGLICLENGIFDLRKGKFQEHSIKYYFKTKIPIFYGKKASCPNSMKFFSEALYPDDINLIQEWFGYNLYNKYFEKKAVILFGDTDTGKTVFVTLLTNFLGTKNIVGLSLQKITNAKSFDLMFLKDKYANIHDDLGAKDLTDTGGFKIATGGGDITGEEKFGDIHGFRTFAKLTFATNKIPAVKDIDDDAYWSRWFPIQLDNQVEKEKQNKFLEEKITTKEELSGLFNWAVIGLQRLIKNNKFSFNKSISEVKNIMQRSSHPLAIFTNAVLTQENGHKVTKEDMFKAYTKWCQENELSSMTKDQIGKQLNRFAPYISEGRNKKVRCWVNVALGQNYKSQREDTTLHTFQKSIKSIEDNHNNDDNDNNNGNGNPIHIKNEKPCKVVPTKEEKVTSKANNLDWTEEDKGRMDYANKKGGNEDD